MIIVTDPDPAFRARIAKLLGDHGDLIEVERLTELEPMLAERNGHSTVVLLGPGLSTEEALEQTARMQQAAPDVSVLFVTGGLTSKLLQAMMRAGVRDVLPTSFTPKQLEEAVARAGALSRQLRDHGPAPEEPDGAKDHKLLTVFSSKGGCGKSFIASNLAVILAKRSGKGVGLVDLDLEFGDLAIMLQLFPARTLSDAAQSIDRLDAEALRGYLTAHRSGTSVLAAPLEPGLAETISAEAAQKILGMMKESFPYTVVDTPASFTDHVLATLDDSDRVVLVTTLDVPSIKNLKLSLQTLEMLGVARERITLVMNRADSKVGLNLQEVEKTIKTTIDVSIPSSREVPLSVNRGVPLVLDAPKSPVAAALFTLADALTAQPSSVRVPAPSGRFRIGRRQR